MMIAGWLVLTDPARRDAARAALGSVPGVAVRGAAAGSLAVLSESAFEAGQEERA